MIVDQDGLHPEYLAQEFAGVLGDGSGVVAEASMGQCALIAPVHFLAYLARTGGALLRTGLLEPRRMNIDRFCDALYDVGLEDDRVPGMPMRFASDELNDASRRLWAAFEERMTSVGSGRGSEALFMIVLLEHLDRPVLRTLTAAAGSEDALQRFRDMLVRRAGGGTRQAVFDEATGRVVEAAFDASGRRALHLLREETAGLGYKRATAMHLLYALVGVDNGVLQRALQFQGLDPLRDVHGYLSRELTRAGSKRLTGFELARDTMHHSVQRMLETAAADADRQGTTVSELHLARALLAAPTGIVPEFLAARKVNVEIAREYLARAEVEVEESTDNRRLPIQEIEASLRRNLLGQEHAIRQILPWLKRLRFGFPRERGAAAVLLFLGPSGTGKTQLAKELARTVYGSEDDLIMLEMGQFNAKESINLFIGAPPGYVGYGEGKLTNGLRDRPQSVVLFDEIEKAHEDVWVALLRFLDEGLISDPAGPTRDGRKCIVVLTSNIAADKLAGMLSPDGADADQLSHQLEDTIREEVTKYLKRPEIYNRVDDKVVFLPFGPDTYLEMVQRFADAETRKFGEQFNVAVAVQREVVEWLAGEAALLRKEGARCVPRLANRFIVAPVIDLLTSSDRQVRTVVVSRRGNGTVAEER